MRPRTAPTPACGSWENLDKRWQGQAGISEVHSAIFPCLASAWKDPPGTVGGICGESIGQKAWARHGAWDTSGLFLNSCVKWKVSEVQH